MLKLDGATGAVLWSSGYANPFGLDESAHALAVDDLGNAFITGRGHVLMHRMQILTAKFAAEDGRMMWMVTRGDEQFWDDTSWDIVLPADGHPVITGTYATSDTTADFYTAQLDSADGSTRWEQRVPGAVIEEAEAGWLRILPGGDLVMCNRTHDGSDGIDIVLHRYRASDGAVVWSTTWGSAPGVDDDPRGLILSSAGEPVVFGRRAQDALALKFDPATGQLLWQADFDGPAQGEDEFSCAMTDPEGRLLLAGVTAHETTRLDALLTELDPVSGEVVWFTNWDGGNALDDEARDLTANVQGQVFLTGTGFAPDTAADLLTIAFQDIGTTSTPAAPASQLQLSAYPNPFNPRVRLSFEMPAGGDAVLSILDARGRRVALLHSGPVPSGNFVGYWNGRDEAGRPLGAGRYLAHLQYAGTSVSRKLLLLK